VSADTAIRLGRFFDVDPRFWLNLQAAYDLSVAEGKNDYSNVRPRSRTAA
jgi:addiction module HigA family antidote